MTTAKICIWTLDKGLIVVFFQNMRFWAAPLVFFVECEMRMKTNLASTW